MVKAHPAAAAATGQLGALAQGQDIASSPLDFEVHADLASWSWREMPHQGTSALSASGSFALTATTHLRR